MPTIAAGLGNAMVAWPSPASRFYTGGQLNQIGGPEPTNLISQVKDDFSDGVLDGIKFGWAAEVTPIEIGGAVRLPSQLANDTTLWTAGNKVFDQAHVRISAVQAPADGASMKFANFMAWAPATQPAGTMLGFYIDFVFGFISFVNWVDRDDPDEVILPFNLADHRWLKIRQTGADITWETSPDGIAWVVRRTLLNGPAWMRGTDLGVMLQVGQDGGVPGYVDFDSLNMMDPATRVSNDLDVRWKTFAPAIGVSSSVDLRWKSTGSVSTTLDARWRVRSSVISSVDLRWKSSVTIFPLLDVRWRSYTTINRVMDLRWKTLANAGYSETLFPSSATPNALNIQDGVPLTLGTRFTVLQAGKALGAKWFAPTNLPSGTVNVYLWSNSFDQIIGPVPFVGLVAGQWNTVMFENPPTLTVGLNYTIFIRTPDRYTAYGFWTWPASTGDRIITESTAPGRFNDGAEVTLPQSSFNNTNYFVDIIFGDVGASTTPVNQTLTIPWRSMERISTTIDLRWKSAATISSSLDVRWRSQVGMSSSVDLRWKSSGTVSSSMDLRWKSAGIVTTSMDLRWRSRIGITQSVSVPWRVYSSIQASVDVRWKTSTQVSATLAVPYKLAGRVSSDLDLQWRLVGGLNQTLDLRYRVSSPVAATIEMRWRSSTSISQSVSLPWKSRTAVSNQVEARWRSYVTVAQSSELRWQVRTGVAATVEMRWRDFVAVQQTVDSRWRSAARISSDLAVQWKSFTAVSQSTSLTWRSRAQAQRDVDLRWNVDSALETVSTTVDLRWRSVLRVSQNIDIAWHTLTSLSTTVEMRWGYLDGVASDLVIPWLSYRKVPAVDLGLPWQARTAVSNQVEFRWQNRGGVRADVTLAWRSRLAVTTSVDVRWYTRTSIAKELDLRWGMPVLVTTTLDVRWSARARITKDLALRWKNEGEIYIVMNDPVKINRVTPRLSTETESGRVGGDVMPVFVASRPTSKAWKIDR